MKGKLVVAMVGLPARGKSTMARKLQKAFTLDGMKVKVFNNGELRRKLAGPGTSSPEFFSPTNPDGVALREKFAAMNLKMAREFLQWGGEVAIIDAANVTIRRRMAVESSFPGVPVLFLECVNWDREVLEANLHRKASLEEFSHLSLERALESFKKRIEHYETAYEPLCRERNQLIVDSFEGKVIHEKLEDSILHYERLRDVVVTRYVENLYLVRHGQTWFNLEDRIGGDPELTPQGWLQAEIMAEHFSKERIPLIFTSSLKRAVQTAAPIARRQTNCTIVPLKEFDEIKSGICEQMTYCEIKDRYPEVYEARKRDKYGYVYPGGEGYVSMEKRVERGLKKVFYLSDPEDSILIVGHRGVNRMILSHFFYRKKEEVPYIFMPQDGYYHVKITPNFKLFELKRFQTQGGQNLRGGM